MISQRVCLQLSRQVACAIAAYIYVYIRWWRIFRYISVHACMVHILTSPGRLLPGNLIYMYDDALALGAAVAADFLAAALGLSCIRVSHRSIYHPH